MTMSLRHSISRFCVSILLVAMFLSCDKNIVFSEFQPVQDKIWDKQAEFVFRFEIKDASIPYNISLQLRNSRLYPYQNLYVIFEDSRLRGNDGDGEDSSLRGNDRDGGDSSLRGNDRDTIECILADSTGKWTGNGITLFQNVFMLKTNYHFPDTGTYTISIRHAMVDESLKGIEDVGILIERVQPSFRPESMRRKINNRIVNPNREEPP